mmetsp:Transcript_17606/g.66978  ORF Transcript_17606/g.66978 Transcript_17606/m.66978 type:complete len:402 (+) Transcript_17606:12-1217(+)
MNEFSRTRLSRHVDFLRNSHGRASGQMQLGFMDSHTETLRTHFAHHLRGRTAVELDYLRDLGNDSLLEEAAVKRLRRPLQVVRVNDQGDVDLRGALAEHVHGDSLLAKNTKHDTEHLGGALHIGNQRQDGLVLLQRRPRDALQILQHPRDGFLLPRVEGQRYRHFARRHHVHRQLVLVEGLEDAGQETILPEHSRADNVDDLHPLLGRDCRAEGIAHVPGCSDHRPGMSRVVAVLHSHRNTGIHCRHHRDRVQHLGSKVCKLGGLLIGHFLDGDGGCHGPRVGGHDAIDVLPDLDLVQLASFRQDGSGKVAATASQRRDAAVHILADEASDDRHDVLIEAPEALAQLLVRLGEDLRAAKIRGREHPKVPRVEGLRWHADAIELRRHKSNAAALAKTHEVVQ